MRSFFLNFFAFLVILSSINFGTPALDISSGDVDVIQSMDLWDNDPLTNPSQKFTEAHLIIAQDFIPIVLISDHSEPTPRFDHYLPLYQLQRVKEYFLLI